MPLSIALKSRQTIPFAALALAAAWAAPSLFSQQLVTPAVTGVPEDWSHHHVVFSQPANPEQKRQIEREPRYSQQVLRRAAAAQAPAPDLLHRPPINRPTPSAEPAITKDWSAAMTSGATVATVGPGNYPAKYSFSTSGTPNCASATTPDYVAYNTGLTGSSTQASIVAYDNLYTGTCTGTVPSAYWAFNTGGTITTSVVLSATGAQLAFVQTPSSGSVQLVLLKWAAKPAGRSLTGGITSGSANFTVTSGLTELDIGAGISGTAVPAGATIATYTSATAGTMSANATAKETSETLAITADAGHPDTLTAVANASYSACTAPCMTTIALNGSGTVTDTYSLPFYDYSGDILYVGDDSGKLHKFHPVFSGTPAEVLSSSAPWVSVSANKLTSPVYDSASGNVFVADAGASGGYLYSYEASSGTHKMTSSKLTYASGTVGIVDGPLIDSTAETVYVFVGQDSNTSTSNGCGVATGCSGVFQFTAGNTTSGSGACVSSSATAWSTSGGITANCGEEQYLGSGTTSDPSIYDGSFDNQYYSGNGTTGHLWICSANGTSEPRLSWINFTNSSGFLPSGDISYFSYSSNVLLGMTSAAAACSPVTEIYGTGATTNDYIFLSVTANSNLPVAGSQACAVGGACLYNFNITNSGHPTTLTASATNSTKTFTVSSCANLASGDDAVIDIEVTGTISSCSGTTLTVAARGLNGTAGGTHSSGAVVTDIPGVAAAGIAITGGSSGIVVDNTSASAGASQIYYSALGDATCSNGTEGCAIQASQSAP